MTGMPLVVTAKGRDALSKQVFLLGYASSDTPIFIDLRLFENFNS